MESARSALLRGLRRARASAHRRTKRSIRRALCDPRCGRPRAKPHERTRHLCAATGRDMALRDTRGVTDLGTRARAVPSLRSRTMQPHQEFVTAPVKSENDPEVTIILPVYNEVEHLEQEVRRIVAAMDASEYTY